MDYKIFNSYEEFLLREDKKQNGMSENFYKLHEEFLIIHTDNNNEGCWNCLNCVKCKDCVFCENCKLCENCTHCKECLKLKNERNIYCVKKTKNKTK